MFRTSGASWKPWVQRYAKPSSTRISPWSEVNAITLSSRRPASSTASRSAPKRSSRVTTLARYSRWTTSRRASTSDSSKTEALDRAGEVERQRRVVTLVQAAQAVEAVILRRETQRGRVGAQLRHALGRIRSVGHREVRDHEGAAVRVGAQRLEQRGERGVAREQGPAVLVGNVCPLGVAELRARHRMLEPRVDVPARAREHLAHGLGRRGQVRRVTVDAVVRGLGSREERRERGPRLTGLGLVTLEDDRLGLEALEGGRVGDRRIVGGQVVLVERTRRVEDHQARTVRGCGSARRQPGQEQRAGQGPAHAHDPAPSALPCEAHAPHDKPNEGPRYGLIGRFSSPHTPVGERKTRMRCEVVTVATCAPARTSSMVS